MPPQSRGTERPSGFAQSKSSPNLTTMRSFPQPAFKPPSPYLNPLTDNDLTDEDLSTDEEDEEGEHEDDESVFPTLDGKERGGLYATRSHPHLPPSSSQLFPPFYNRPPTPLPPSPSLTSLLRPSFSTHTSHHTTPDSSDTESGSAAGFPLTAATTAASSQKGGSSLVSRQGPAHPKVPTYEYYGFALYLASSLFFLAYTLWAYLPSPFLHQLGIYYYPNRWWALAIPCWIVVLLMWIYAALASYNTGTMTLPMGSVECVVDQAGQVAIVDETGRIIRERGKSRFAENKHESYLSKKTQRRSKGGVRKQRSRQGSMKEEKRVYVPADLGHDVKWTQIWNEGTDAVMDVPLGGVCEILYGAGRDMDDHDSGVI